ncbi:protein serine/threonine phosphatase 2C [Lojkania enalia]|uniref:Protein serine/threonine phosphatase 2C n=1 Tax=Lojkania enalia TaxID=147567 RepID=A0A9P4K091_9PLEO|nr:protein serine/threonine phosphatase 2C [Didymosphaeria enalia]
MNGIRWRGAIRLLDRASSHAPRLPLRFSKRIFTQKHSPGRQGQCLPQESRAFSSFSARQRPSLYQADGVHAILRPPNAHVLQSAFPKKTVIFLLALGAALYFIDVAIDDVEISDITPFNDFPEHFYQTKEEVEHILDAHVADSTNKEHHGPNMEWIDREFANLAGKIMMTEDQARKAELPITHAAAIGSNMPPEDYYAVGTAPGPGDDRWNFWGVYDGHAGSFMARMLQLALIPYVSRDLSGLPPFSSSSIISQTIMKSFANFDREQMSRANRAASWYPALNSAAQAALQNVMSGSCALLAIFDPKASKLRVACTGDSRAVLGRWDYSGGKYTAIPLSKDQTGFNQDEVKRIMAEHPEEPDIIDPKTGRLLGIAVTRAFGDHRWKWDNDLVTKVKYKFFGPEPRLGNKTPPYMTAEPVITEADIQRGDRGEKADFMIVASDGLWDRMSSEHAVECVNRWLEARARGNGSIKSDPLYTPPPPISEQPYQLDPGVEFEPEKGRHPRWRAEPNYFAIEDENAAVCLIRNALGGTRRQLFHGLMVTASPFRRSIFDDTTVLVVFFDRVKGLDGEKEEKKVGRWWWPFS